MSENKSPDNSRYDCIIMGGGMVGGAIALGLEQAGFHVAVVEPSQPKPFDPLAAPELRVSAISYASEQVLRNLGAWGFIEGRRSCPYRRLAVNEIHEQTGLVSLLPDISAWATTEFDAAKINQTHLGHIVENRIVQEALLSTLQSDTDATLFCPDSAVSMALSGEEKTVTLASGNTLTAPLVIGADGANSEVRRVVGIGQYKEQYEQHAFVLSVVYDGEQEDITWQSFRRQGPLAFLPMPKIGDEQYASLVWYDSAERISELIALDNDALLKEVKSAFPAKLPELVKISGRGRFPLFKSHAHEYAVEGVVLAGDAAHTINPLAGQGVNLGFVDAASLVEVLANARMQGEDFASLAVLKRYEHSRRRANQIMMSAMDVFYYGFSNKHLPVRIARNLGLGLAQRAGFAKNEVIKYAMGIAGKPPRLSKPI